MNDEKERRYLTPQVTRMPTELANTDPLKMLSMETLSAVSLLPTFDEQIHAAAKYYISLGWLVLPLRPPDSVERGESTAKKLPKKSQNINYSHASINPKTIDGWFDPDKGKFAGCNIAIACGNKADKGVVPIFVIDADNHGEEDGITNLKNLQRENSWFPKGPVATTPNGGEHYFFAWQDHCGGSAGRLGKAIDTRGGTNNSCKGHVVVFPSRTPDGLYKFAQGGNLPPTPTWVVEKMDKGRSGPREGEGLGNEEVTEEDLERPIEEGQVVSMLAAINPDDLEYDDWLRLGMSIKSQLGGDEGLAIWDEWSASGNRYKVNECSTRWNGFSDLGAVRGGTLFYFASEAGWKPDYKKGERSGNPHDELVAKMNGEYGVVLAGSSLRILRERATSGEEDMHYSLLHERAFEGLLANEFIMSGGEKPKPQSVAKVWMTHKGRRTYKNGLGLYPNNDTPEGKFNTWNGFGVVPQAGDCTLFKAHLLDVLCSGNEEYYSWILDWCADLMQDPANPKGCAIVLRGEEGTGKGTFGNTINRIFASHGRHLIDDSHLTSNFNAHLIDAVVVFADEITWGGNKKTAGKLKGLITEKILLAERKGVDAIPYRNMVHLIVASNGDWIVPAGYNSRRWFVLEVPDTRMKDFEYFASINRELDSGGIEAFTWEMLHRKYNVKTLHNVIATDALQIQREKTSTTHVHHFLVWMLEKGEAVRDDKYDIWYWSDVEEAYRLWCDHNKGLLRNEQVRPDTTIRKEIKVIMNGGDEDLIRVGKRVTINKVKISPLVLGSLADCRNRIRAFVSDAFPSHSPLSSDTLELPEEEWESRGV